MQEEGLKIVADDGHGKLRIAIDVDAFFYSTSFRDSFLLKLIAASEQGHEIVVYGDACAQDTFGKVYKAWLEDMGVDKASPLAQVRSRGGLRGDNFDIICSENPPYGAKCTSWVSSKVDFGTKKSMLDMWLEADDANPDDNFLSLVKNFHTNPGRPVSKLVSDMANGASSVHAQERSLTWQRRSTVGALPLKQEEVSTSKASAGSRCAVFAFMNAVAGAIIHPVRFLQGHSQQVEELTHHL